MLLEKNIKSAFYDLVKNRFHQNPKTILVAGNLFSFTTKSGIQKIYIGFNNYMQYRKSGYYPQNVETVNGFAFVEIRVDRHTFSEQGE